ncbi:MAG: hypothetical protein II981_03340 [Bacteroidales bacterium]|nr:hypothetical protein [Bacteroidales bacterium]
MIVEVVSGTVIVVSAALGVAIAKHKEVKQKSAEIEALSRSLNGYAETYIFENADINMIHNCKNTIEELFGNDIGNIEKEFAKRKTIEDKKRYAQEIVHKIAGSMNVRIDAIKIENLPVCLYGVAYTNDENDDMYGIMLNEILVIDNPIQFVKTTCHELRHLVQYQAILNNIWGFSNQRIAQYMYGSKKENYVDEGSMDAYKKQSIENDANKYADAVMDAAFNY